MSPDESRAEAPARATRLLTVALFAVAAIVAGAFLATAGRDGSFAIDLRQAFLPAAGDVLHGRNPYPRVDDLSATQQTAYVYPPLAAEVLAPLSWIPSLAVATALVIVLALCVPAILWTLQVRDARCYAVAFLWGPVLAALQTGNLTLPLALAAALAWRFRDDRRGTGALALALAPKLFLWPLAVWALTARRRRSAVVAVAAAGLVTLLTWAAIGFAGLSDYPHVLRRLQDLEEPSSYTSLALLRALGAGEGVSRALWLACGLAVLVICVALARRGDDRRAFTLAIAASVLLTPIVWIHYFVLLLVPLAVARPKLDWVWLLPVVLIGASGTGNGGVARTLLALGVAAVVVAASLAPSLAGVSRLRRAYARG